MVEDTTKTQPEDESRTAEAGTSDAALEAKESGDEQASAEHDDAQIDQIDVNAEAVAETEAAADAADVEGDETASAAEASDAEDASAEEPTPAEDENSSETDASAGAESSAETEQGSDAPAEEKPSPIPAEITTTTLFFLAPDLPPVPERPRRERDDEDRPGRKRRNRRRDDDAQDNDSENEQTNSGSSDEEREGKRSRRRGRRNRSNSNRESESSNDEPITEPQKIKGSTRLEAKRQRRRESRETGRHRQSITETEFLARRESVDRTMLVRAKGGRVQIGVLEDRVLVEHYVARSSEASLIGNVYLGRVQNVLPSMEAAFVDIGRGRNAVLYSGEVDWSKASLPSNKARRIENALKVGDRVLVQVSKDPVGHKGARLTSQISLPGRYLVYVPGNSLNGISRKLPDTERNRLKKILKEVLPEGMGVIVRTAAEGATKEQLERDVKRLKSQWESIEARVQRGNAPAMLHSEPDLLVKIVRDVFNEDFNRMIIQGKQELETIREYLEAVAPDLVDRIEEFEGDDLFTAHRANEQIEKALDRKVWLPSGGSLVIDRTEAMTVVDVNTGKFVGSGGNLEETVTKNNLEAAEEVVRQLRLRDIGGIIVVDFIDMVLESNRDLVLRRLVECLSRDRTRHQVAEVTSLGLVQMTRKKIGLGLLETFSESCDCCNGRGVIIHHEPIDQKPAADATGRGRRSRKNRDAGRRTRTSGSSSQMHEVTDAARSALSQIAASTIAGSKDETRDEDVKETVPVDMPDDAPNSTEESGEQERRSKRSRRSRRNKNRDRSEQSEATTNSDATAGDAPTSLAEDEAAPETLIAQDLAQLVPQTPEASSEEPTPDLAALDKVLAALPNPDVDDEAEAPETVAEGEEQAPAAEAPAAAAEEQGTSSRGRRRRGGRRRVTTDTISTDE